MGSVLLVSDDTIFSLGLAALIESDAALEFLGAATDREALWEALRRTIPDIVVLDLQTRDSASLCSAITAQCPESPVLAFAGAEDGEDTLFAAVRAGARGYVVKTADTDHVLAAINTVVAGDGFLDPSVTLSVIAWATGSADHAYVADGLSPRELEVLGYVVDGEPNKRIARRMGLTENTVKTYLRRAYRKLNCHTRSAAAAMLARRSIA